MQLILELSELLPKGGLGRMDVRHVPVHNNWGPILGFVQAQTWFYTRCASLAKDVIGCAALAVGRITRIRSGRLRGIVVPLFREVLAQGKDPVKVMPGSMPDGLHAPSATERR